MAAVAEDVEGPPDFDITEALSQEPFDPIAVLNQLLPDEASLENLDIIHARLREQEAAMQEELDTLLVELQRDQDPERMQIIQELIAELLSQINRIREKASESEAVVREITKDIQVLDLAKKNILQTVTTLKRFQMLANAVGQLERQISTRKYADISQTLAAVKEVAAVFKPYTAVERIAVMWKRVQELQGQLRTMIDEDFDAFFLQDATKGVTKPLLNDACLVVDVLGPDVRNHIIDRYCGIEFREYRRIFRASDEAGQLDNISRRFAWFRRILANHEEEHVGVFPKEWKVGQCLCARFSEITRDDMLATLSKAGSSLTVTLLLDTLRQTLEFEQSMATKFRNPFTSIIQASSVRDPKTISSAFEGYMGIYVDAQDKALSEMISAYRGPKSRSSIEESTSSANASSSNSQNTDPSSSRHSGTAPDGDTENAVPPVLPSSTDLFYFYGQNLEHCAKLSNKGAMYELVGVYKKWLRIYAEDVLVSGMKRRPQAQGERRSVEGRVNIAEIRNVCLLLNTAEYCQVTASELEEKLKEKISDEFREKVALQAERTLFVNVISTAIAVLLRELETACETHFATLTRTLWANVKNVSGQSPYMTELVVAINTVVDLVRSGIDKKKYTRNFYDKSASLIITKFTNALVRSRPIKEAGAQQLLIDLQALKATLLRLPGEQPDGASAPASFARHIQTQATSLETLLKIVDVPSNPPDEFIQNYTLLVGDMSFSNFQKVLDLKGTPRIEQGALLDTFVTSTSTREDLASSSFLSSIDMDPPVPGQPPLVPNPTVVDQPRSIFGGLSSPQLESGAGTPTGGAPERREVFSDLKRFVNFAVRRDRDQR